MAENRHKTTIEIGIDDREVVGLGKDIERTFDPRMIENFERSIDRLTRAFEKLGEAQSKLDGGAAGGAAGGTQTPGSLGSGGGGSDVAREVRALRDEFKKSSEEDRKAQRSGEGVVMGMLKFQLLSSAMRMGQGAISGQATSTALGALPVVGGLLGGAAQQAVALYGEFAQQRMAQAGVFGSTGIGVRGMSALVRQSVDDFGIQPGAAPGLIGQFGAASGLAGGRLAGAFGTNLAMQQLLGVQQAGAMIGAGEVAGGRVDDPAALMEESVSAGLIAGFRLTKIDQFLGNVSSYVDQARSQGINIDASGAARFFASFANSGASFQGEAGAQFAGNFAQGFQGAGRGQGWAHGFALRAAGFGSGRNLQEALEAIESDPEVRERFVQMIRDQVGADNVVAGAYIVREAMSGIGVQMSAVQSRELFQNGTTKYTHLPNEAAAAMEQRRAEGTGVFAAGQHVGNLALERQGIGADMAETATKIQNFDMMIMRTGMAMVEPILNGLVEMGQRMFTAFQEGGFGGLLRTIGDEIGVGLVNALRGLLREFFPGLNIPELRPGDITREGRDLPDATAAAASREEREELEVQYALEQAREGRAVRTRRDTSNNDIRRRLRRFGHTLDAGEEIENAAALEHHLLEAAVAAGRLRRGAPDPGSHMPALP